MTVHGVCHSVREPSQPRVEDHDASPSSPAGHPQDILDPCNADEPALCRHHRQSVHTVFQHHLGRSTHGSVRPDCEHVGIHHFSGFQHVISLSSQQKSSYDGPPHHRSYQSPRDLRPIPFKGSGPASFIATDEPIRLTPSFYRLEIARANVCAVEVEMPPFRCPAPGLTASSSCAIVAGCYRSGNGPEAGRVHPA